MTHGLKVLATLPEEQGSIPNAHTVTHNHLKVQVGGIQCPLLVSAGTRYTDIHSPRMNILKEISDICETTCLLEGQRRGPKEVSWEEDLSAET